ncbi:MAG TPA: LEA type 2 family protein [Thermoanaerobaculia bacterium]|nr:LEA type 2 family protein [Thermoanaerobaculia bacterium]
MKRNLIYATLFTAACFVLAVLTLSLSGCSSVASALNIVNPRYSIRDIRPRVAIALPLSASTIDFDFTLGVDNPNSVELRLDRVDFDLLVNDNPVLNSISRDPRVDIPARGLGEVHLQTQLAYNNVRTLFRDIADAVQGNRARYEIRGNAYYGTPLGQMRFPVTVYSTR